MLPFLLTQIMPIPPLSLFYPDDRERQNLVALLLSTDVNTRTIALQMELSLGYDLSDFWRDLFIYQWIYDAKSIYRCDPSKWLTEENKQTLLNIPSFITYRRLPFQFYFSPQDEWGCCIMFARYFVHIEWAAILNKGQFIDKRNLFLQYYFLRNAQSLIINCLVWSKWAAHFQPDWTWLLHFDYIYEIKLLNYPLDTLPEVFKELCHIKRLEIQALTPLDIPQWLLHLPELRVLDIHHTPIRSFGEQMGKQLTSLSLRRCSLKAIPTGVLAAKWLKSLDISYNNITELPKMLFGLHHLTSLMVQGNPGTHWLDGWAQLRGLHHLRFLSWWDDKYIQIVGNTLAIYQLKLNEVEWAHVFKTLSIFNYWRSITIAGTNLTTIPSDFLERCICAKEIYLMNNLLTEIPRALTRLKKLQILDLSANPIPQIPDWINRITELRTLRLNKLKLKHGLYNF